MLNNTFTFLERKNRTMCGIIVISVVPKNAGGHPDPHDTTAEIQIKNMVLENESLK